MPRPLTGSMWERETKRGKVFGVRFTAGGVRQFQTLDVETRAEAEAELANILADVRRGLWQPLRRSEPESTDPVPTFHRFASDWLEMRRPELMPRTFDDYEWAISTHLLPVFKDYRVDEITPQLVDEFKARKLREGDLSPNTLNKVLGRLAQILEAAVEYGLIASNPAAGRRRRVKGTKPRRPWVEPEQLLALFEAAEGMLGGRGRPLMAVLAGAGLRIDEALSLERRHVNLRRGTITVARSKTEAGVRVVDLPPALREELAVWLYDHVGEESDALVFGTSSGRKDSRQNIRRRLFMKAIPRANERLSEVGIDLIGDVRPHGLRRTYASLRAACGDDVVYISRQLGHADVRFSLNVYAQAVKRRERMTAAEQVAYDRAREWASWAEGFGTSAISTPAETASNSPFDQADLA